ncbi:MAG: bifunctional GNAT family N-acetyltransferase/carbon-nitrogen hydrolase family protein [Lysobacterales bacterium]
MQKTTAAAAQPTLQIRPARAADVLGIVALSARVYSEEFCYTSEMVHGQLSHFPQGQFVAELEGKIVGYCATFRVSEEIALSPHTWRTITGGGFASRHDAEGDWLYGMEVCVDPAHRGFRLGRRLYDARKRLCANLDLKGIVFGGRLPGLSRRIKKFGSAEAYVEAVVQDRVRDGTLSFQLRNGYTLLGLLKNYLPSDRESLGWAAHLVWRNPSRAEHPAIAKVQDGGKLPDVVRVATVQYQQRRIASFDQFAAQVEYFVDVAADYNADFVVFPELITLQLLSVENAPLSPADSIRSLTSYTQVYGDMLTRLAVRYNINIIGGSHPTHMPDGDIHNNCYVALRDGSLHVREKLHPTPNERRWWKISGGEGAQTIMTDCGPIGIMICYDSEFPELGRHLTDQGALLLFVPFCTDVRQGYLRVRYSCAARAVENQVYVVLSGNVGNLPGVNNFDIQYAQSCILTPCDFHFAPEGVAADTTPNVEAVAFADLRIDALLQSRASGSVQNLKDRRHDLYQLNWRKHQATPE